ncbi:hypothetical protein ACQ4M4_00220 [Leptolyngbya sp. AN02str]|uniref:hypothetical protein n=1 Tax=Leptolyngbya sp. AN02str TaxID=3423363 RepID=UPI003D319120
MKSLKQLVALSTGVFFALGAGLSAPVSAQEMSVEEVDALENNLIVLCDASFEELADMGIEFNEAGEVYLDVACDAVLDGIDESDFDDEEFADAIDFLAEALASVTYE